MNQKMQQLRQIVREKLEEVPEKLSQPDSLRQIIIHVFYNAMQGMDLMVLPAWKPPRSTRESLDLAAFDLNSEIPSPIIALVADPLVELPRVRSLDWLECPHKIYVTYSTRTDKVKPTTLFLKPEHLHIDIFAEQTLGA